MERVVSKTVPTVYIRRGLQGTSLHFSHQGTLESRSSRTRVLWVYPLICKDWEASLKFMQVTFVIEQCEFVGEKIIH